MRCKINYDTDNASTVNWISDEYKISELVPYIYSIHCDGGEEFEELFGDDFKQIELNNFRAVEGDEENLFALCFEAIFEFDEAAFSNFKTALEFSSNHIEIKLNFLDKSGNELDIEDLYEGHSDIPKEIEIQP